MCRVNSPMLATIGRPRLGHLPYLNGNGPAAMAQATDAHGVVVTSVAGSVAGRSRGPK